jgi:hypothetical protein
LVEYPPYVNNYGKLKQLFAEIAKATVPPKFTQDFLNTVLGLKSSSDRAFIPFLKRLGFLDQSNTPTQDYKDYRDETRAKKVMASRVRQSYHQVFQANEYAYNLDKKDFNALLKRITGAGNDDQVLPSVVGTFFALKELSDFESKLSPKLTGKLELPETKGQPVSEKPVTLGLSYTIILNLPATTEIAVFNAIFKSLKENILNE